MKLINYMISPEGQRVVADFKVHGIQVFTPSVMGLGKVLPHQPN